jgi:5-(carboxyamino)imidazole ribonucleotide synthase
LRLRSRPPFRPFPYLRHSKIKNHIIVKGIINTGFKVGILGGGQLGKMLALAAQNWELETWIMDESRDFPAVGVCNHFVEGSFKDFDDVYNFGKQVDVLTIEIEHVNTEALLKLEAEGLKIHPSPTALNIIKDKGLQKQFYVDQNLPTSHFDLYENAAAINNAIENGRIKFPFVQKSRTAGYDGRGVAVIKSAADLPKLIDSSSIIEPLVDIQKEIAVIVARNEAGEVRAFPPVEMEFNPVANLVEFIFCPADISPSISEQAIQIAEQTIKAYDICGLLAVELFLTNDNEILINEVAPRPHNSGHQTIDSAICSQFQQHLRAIINYPLGDTTAKFPSVMVNLLGAEGHTGKAQYLDLKECFKVDGAKFHIYGKTITKPFRKMGHVTVVDTDLGKAKEKAKFIQETLKIVAE